MKKIATLFLSLLAVSLSATTASAVTTPSFPACTNPQGPLKVAYDAGVHGIVGSTAEYRGSDKVFTVSDTQYMQCFCPDTGSEGIQTNWLNVAKYSSTDIQVLKNEGWVYIPNGGLWGLTNDPYVAKNTTYACREAVQAASQSVLATTGTLMPLFGLLLAGSFALIAGFMVRGLKQEDR